MYHFYVQYKYNLHYGVQLCSLGKGINPHKLSVFIKFTLSLFHQGFKQNLAHHFCTILFSRLYGRELASPAQRCCVRNYCNSNRNMELCWQQEQPDRSLPDR